MFGLLNSRYFWWFVNVILVIFLFVTWRANENKTKQIEEVTKQKQTLTKQLEIAYEKPKTKEIHKKGRTIVKEKITHQTTTGTITTEERTIIEEPTITEVESEPIIPKELFYSPPIEKKYQIQSAYYLDKTAYFGVGRRISESPLSVGLSIKGNIENLKKTLSAGIYLQVEF